MVLMKRRCEGVCPRPPLYSKCSLADEDGLAAGLLDGFLGGLGELVGVDGDCGLDLSVIEDLDEAVLLAEEAKGDDLVQGELGDAFGGGDLGDAVEAENLVLDAEDVGEAALGQTAVQGLKTFDLPTTQGVVVFATLAIITLNLVVDLLYAVIDPRIRLA